MSAPRESLGAYLKRLRTERGWSLRLVEKLTRGRVSNAYLSQLEGDKIDSPSIIILHRLATAYAVDFAEMTAVAVAGEPPLPRIQSCPTCGQPLLGTP